jgi:hypothetical protein
MAVRRPLFFDLTKGDFSETANADALTIGQYQALGIGGVAFTGNSCLVSNIADPVAATDAATKGYVDRLEQGISLIPSVKVMSNANVPLTGLQTIDGQSLVAGDRVLLTGQNNPIQNGVYLVASGPWSRPTNPGDYMSGRAFAGLFTYVESGTNFATEQWAALGAGTGKVDTDASSWTQLTGAAEIIAGNGLAKSAINGNTLSAVLATNSGLQFTGGQFDTLLDTAGSLKKSASGLAVALNANNTLASDSNGLRTLGLPGAFTISGTATSPAVTAGNVNTLVAGASSIADTLHQHQNVLSAKGLIDTVTNGATALAAGDPWTWGSTSNTIVRSDATGGSGTALCRGVALTAIAANGTGQVVRQGVAAGVLSGATPGAPYFLAPGGGLTATIPGSGYSVVRLGLAVNATDLDVNPQTLLVRNAG